MAQTSTIGRTATTVKRERDATVVRYHNTDVVVFTDSHITLDTGGWFTSTTKVRMNQASNQFDLGYTVSQKDFQWTVTYKGIVMPFGTTSVTFKR